MCPGLVVLFSLIILSSSYVAYATGPATDIKEESKAPFEEREPIVPPRENVTGFATQNTGNVQWSLVAFAPDGRLLYHTATYLNYHDVDPVEGTDTTVLKLASHDACR